MPPPPNPPMLDDYLFADEAIEDSALIAGLDAFEAQHNLLRRQQATHSVPAPAPVPVVAPLSGFRPPLRPAPVPAPTTSRPKPSPAKVMAIPDDDEYKFGSPLDLENADWEEFDKQVKVHIQQQQKAASSVTGPSNAWQFSQTSSGEYQQQTLWGLPTQLENRYRLPSGQKEKTIKKTKTWDRAKYARSGPRLGKDELDDQVPAEFERFPRHANIGELACVLH